MARWRYRSEEYSKPRPAKVVEFSIQMLDTAPKELLGMF
jgi:hypothetical protein